MRKDAQELAVMRKAAILAGEVLEGALQAAAAGSHGKSRSPRRSNTR